jgi:HEAT repeat protein
MRALVLALIVFPGGDLAALGFASPPEQGLTPEQHVRAVLAGYSARKGELLDVGSGRAVEILTRILESSGDSPAAILPPIRALGFMARPQGFDAVARHLNHSDAGVRLAVIRTLGQMNKFDAIPLIEPFLRSPNRDERREAIVALGKFGKTEEIQRIDAAAAGDPDLERLAREAAARIAATVKGLRTGRYDELVDAVIDTAEYEDLVGFIMFTKFRLLEILSDKTRDPRTRSRAITVLSLARVRRAGLPMRDILADLSQPDDLRLRAVWGLGLTRTRSAVPQLAALLDDPLPSMRDLCILSLGRIGDTRALEPLIARWDAADGARRDQLRLALFRLRSQTSVAALLDPLRTYQPRAVAEVYFISDSLELSRGYHGAALVPFLNSPLAEDRRDALLLLATFGTAADSPLLKNYSEFDDDALNREIANLGVERLKDIPLWERA